MIEVLEDPPRAPSYGPVVWDSERCVYRRQNAPLVDEQKRLASAWLVDVYGYDTAKAVAFTASQARFIVFVAFRDAVGGTFREFLARGVHVRLEPCR